MNYSRVENIKYIVVWDLLLQWRTAVRIVTSSPMQKLVPEGVEGRVAYKGNVEDTVFQLMGGLRSGMGYCGTATIEELKENGRFVKISAAALREPSS